MTEYTISASTLRNLTICERRIWLDYHGDAALRVDATSDFAFAGRKHEQAIQAAMFGPVRSIPAADWEERVRITHTLMQEGVAGIQGAAFERVLDVSPSITVRGVIDWLKRVSYPSRFGRWSYEPIEIKLRRELVEADILQLDLYTWLLQGVQESESSGWFWLGMDSDNQPLHILEHSYSEARLFTALGQISTILNASSSPPVFLASHCEVCPWHTLCRQNADVDRDLTIIPGISRQTWEQMRREGISTLDHIFALTPKDLERFKGLGKSKANELHTYAQAVTQSQPIRRNALPDIVRQPGIMLDLETCMDGSRVGAPWCFGWQIGDEPFQVAIVDAYYEGAKLILPDGTNVTIISDSDEGWQLFALSVSEQPGPIYHWGSFEKGVLRNNAPADVIEVLDARLYDLNKTFKQTVVFPVRGTSIKKVAPYLGFAWPEGTSAFSAWSDYQAWLLESDKRALTRACAYNRADVEAMALIRQWMVNNCDLPA